ncbi:MULTISPECIES: trehalose-6-phosphate synthase [unclassified Acinetobacter]|uniref:trehalose-6-phosphate synthase n=1 Tax=unclassified Acinetobacter TaxID=196816 RepID=UPI001909FECA|nr:MULTISPECIES: trehalose-6-phosphate synthase [unclassified Acinetobacter]MBK0064112.1 trehalose-6-phosphate synthase [Acinetobacter sp. S55]MBK0067379.1 trehalose-6-phosphate synthase [Acinetobacter sp. S54]
MSRLIILSNRVSLPQTGKCVAGGLAVAMQDALSKVGGVWVGWNGEKIENQVNQRFDILYKSKITYMTCPLTQKQYQDYYCGFSNNTLWPMMHDRDDLIEYDHSEYETYQQVNRLFAKKISEFAEPDDLIWVQDYHFLSVARHCRELGMPNKIGFFLHIPFASMKLWKKLPVAQALLEDLCHYNLLGLQTEQDQKTCIQTCAQLLKAQKIQTHLLSLNQNLVSIQHYPIGVDVKGIQRSVKDGLDVELPEMWSKDSSMKTIIGVDRIDYSKGLFERFNAFASFLEQHPETHEKIQHVQIACPCRLDVATYKRLFERFKLKMDLINNEFKQNKWYPIVCSYESKPHHELMQLYRQADICWISSLKDGMNLVAKEFIAAQDPQNPGVLILSKFAGAAEQMVDALVVDPTDRKAMLSALETALNMSLMERKYRYQRLIHQLTNYDINDWCTDFLSDLECSQYAQSFVYENTLEAVSFYPKASFRI